MYPTKIMKGFSGLVILIFIYEVKCLQLKGVEHNYCKAIYKNDSTKKWKDDCIQEDQVVFLDNFNNTLKLNPKNSSIFTPTSAYRTKEEQSNQNIYDEYFINRQETLMEDSRRSDLKQELSNRRSISITRNSYVMDKPNYGSRIILKSRSKSIPKTINQGGKNNERRNSYIRRSFREADISRVSQNLAIQKKEQRSKLIQDYYVTRDQERTTRLTRMKISRSNNDMNNRQNRVSQQITRVRRFSRISAKNDMNTSNHYKEQTTPDLFATMTNPTKFENDFSKFSNSRRSLTKMTRKNIFFRGIPNIQEHMDGKQATKRILEDTRRVSDDSASNVSFEIPSRRKNEEIYARKRKETSIHASKRSDSPKVRRRNRELREISIRESTERRNSIKRNYEDISRSRHSYTTTDHSRPISKRREATNISHKRQEILGNRSFKMENDLRRREIRRDSRVSPPSERYYYSKDGMKKTKTTASTTVDSYNLNFYARRISSMQSKRKITNISRNKENTPTFRDNDEKYDNNRNRRTRRDSITSRTSEGFHRRNILSRSKRELREYVGSLTTMNSFPSREIESERFSTSRIQRSTTNIPRSNARNTISNYKRVLKEIEDGSLNFNSREMNHDSRKSSTSRLQRNNRNILEHPAIRTNDNRKHRGIQRISSSSDMFQKYSSMNNKINRANTETYDVFSNRYSSPRTEEHSRRISINISQRRAADISRNNRNIQEHSNIKRNIDNRDIQGIKRISSSSDMFKESSSINNRMNRATRESSDVFSTTYSSPQTQEDYRRITISSSKKIAADISRNNRNIVEHNNIKSIDENRRNKNIQILSRFSDSSNMFQRSNSRNNRKNRVTRESFEVFSTRYSSAQTEGDYRRTTISGLQKRASDISRNNRNIVKHDDMERNNERRRNRNIQKLSRVSDYSDLFRKSSSRNHRMHRATKESSVISSSTYSSPQTEEHFRRSTHITSSQRRAADISRKNRNIQEHSDIERNFNNRRNRDIQGISRISSSSDMLQKSGSMNNGMNPAHKKSSELFSKTCNSLKVEEDSRRMTMLSSYRKAVDISKNNRRNLEHDTIGRNVDNRRNRDIQRVSRISIYSTKIRHNDEYGTMNRNIERNSLRDIQRVRTESANMSSRRNSLNYFNRHMSDAHGDLSTSNSDSREEVAFRRSSSRDTYISRDTQNIFENNHISDYSRNNIQRMTDLNHLSTSERSYRRNTRNHKKRETEDALSAYDSHQKELDWRRLRHSHSGRLTDDTRYNSRASLEYVTINRQRNIQPVTRDFSSYQRSFRKININHNNEEKGNIKEYEDDMGNKREIRITRDNFSAKEFELGRMRDVPNMYISTRVRKIGRYMHEEPRNYVGARISRILHTYRNDVELNRKTRTRIHRMALQDDQYFRSESRSRNLNKLYAGERTLDSETNYKVFRRDTRELKPSVETANYDEQHSHLQKSQNNIEPWFRALQITLGLIVIGQLVFNGNNEKNHFSSSCFWSKWKNYI